MFARVVKLVYTYALGAYAVRRAGSSPVSRTRFRTRNWLRDYVCGTLAEWLRRGLQNLVRRFNSGRYLHIYVRMGKCGSVAQLVEQRPEEPCVTGSSPVGATI